MFIRWLVTGFLFLSFIARVIHKSNDKSYCVHFVSVVNQKILLNKFQEKK